MEAVLKFEKQNTRTMLTLITSLITMAITVLVNFFLSPYIVKTLGAEANGFTQLATNFINYASLLTIALNSMAGRFITISYYKNDTKAINQFYSSVIVGNLLIFLFLLLPSIYCVVQLDHIVRIEAANILDVKCLFTLVFANFFLSQVISVLNIACYVTNKQYLQNPVIIAKTILYAVLLLVVFSIFPPQIYYVSLVGFILTFFSIPFYLRIKNQIIPELSFNYSFFNFNTVAQLITSGIWNTINQCGNLLMTGFDLLLSNLLIGPAQMGMLAIAKVVPNTIIQIAATTNTSFSPNLTIAYASESKENILRSIRYAMKSSSILVSIPIMVLCIYGQNFYQLWVPSLDSQQLAIISILTCMAFIPFAGPQVLYNVFTTTNKLKVNSITFLLGGLLNILVVIILLKITDLNLLAVAGVSSIISIMRNLMITIPYTAKLLNLKWYTFYKDVGISLLCCAITGIASVFFQRLVIPDNWANMTFSVFLAGFASLFLCILILLKRDEKKQLLQIIKAKMVKNGKN